MARNSYLKVATKEGIRGLTTTSGGLLIMVFYRIEYKITASRIDGKDYTETNIYDIQNCDNSVSALEAFSNVKEIMLWKNHEESTFRDDLLTTTIELLSVKKIEY